MVVHEEQLHCNCQYTCVHFIILWDHDLQYTSHVCVGGADLNVYRHRLRVLLDAMRYVETSFIMPAPSGDNGLSIGPLQIR